MTMSLEQLKEARMQFYLHPITNVRSNYRASIAGAFRLISDPTLYKGITEQLRAIKRQQKAAEEEGRKEDAIAKAKEAATFKKNHFDQLCVSGLFSKKADGCLITHSGMMGIDIDHYGEEHVEELKQEIIHDPMFKKDFELELAFRSPSGDGLKLIVETDPDVTTHAEYFDALRNIFQMRYGINIDNNCKNVSRGCFLPHDIFCYVNPLVCPF